MTVVEKVESKVPQLRFPEFKDSWSKKTIDDLSVAVTSGSRDWAKYYSDTGEKFIRMTNLPKTGINLLLEDLRYVNIPNNSTDGLRTSLQEGDILMSITAELGKIGLVPSSLGKAYINQHTALIRPDKNKITPGFLAQMLASDEARVSLNRLNDSGAKAGLNLSTIRNFKRYSASLEESKKVNSFLFTIDKKISLLKQKHEQLVQYKKGIMQQLFSQQLRFKDDNGQDFPDWEVKPVSSIMKESRVKGSAGDVARKITVKLWGRGVFEKVGKDGSENTQYYTRTAGQFIYSKLDFLNCAFGIVPEELDGLESTVDLPCFDMSEKVNKTFVLEYIKQKRFYKKYGDMADGSRKAKRIHADTFLSFPISLPSGDEQNKIADFLDAIDQKINLAQQQIEQTQTYKQGLLQQMFV